ncbi:NAD(P)/FAD-dependent oxidoreductase [Sphingomonas sp.]|uniref:NAD(P)/FAD-dependent oxidoreductase n=1 Tax=Sphingomonas sp. TaxID=28214 RepID=UPI003B3BDA84
MPHDPHQWRLRDHDHARRVMLAQGSGRAIEHPIWQSRSAPVTPRPSLDSAITAEVAIVGGGVAGVSTALHLAERGVDVALIEAGTLGSGAAGSSAGIIAPQLVRATPDDVRRKLGDAADGMLRLVAESGTYLFDLVRRYGITCDAAETGFIAPLTGRQADRVLNERVREWGGLRPDLRVSDAEETQRLTGCGGYGAAIVDPTGGSVDPLALVRGLADQAERMGSRLYEDSPATQIVRDRGLWSVLTDAGELRARRVVLAANGGNPLLHQRLAGTILPLPVLEVATEPLPSDLLQAILPERHALTDLEPDVFSIRYTSDYRLITAFPASGRDTPADIERRVNQRLADTLVAHRPLALAYVWLGHAWVNASLLPRIVQLDDGLIAAQACNGRGLATNVLLGRELAKALAGRPQDAMIKAEPPRAVSGFLLARHLPRLLLSSALFAKRIKRRLGVA